MHFLIIFYRGGETLGSTPRDCTLDEAKQHARNYFGIHKADLVEVIDDDTKEVLYRYAGESDANT